MQRNGNPPDNVESLITVVSGLGGIGKTQLVREYVNQNKSKYDDNVIWINGDKEKSIIETFRALANDTLNISTIGANGTEKNINSIVQDVYDYFCGKNVLFVYDNVESMDSIRNFLLLGPSRPNSQPYVLITSRIQDWHAGIEVIRLVEWQQSEAIDFVSAIVNTRENVEDIKHLVDDLQCFPLVLRQATSYILHKHDTIRNYRVKYAKQKKQLLDSKLFQNSVSKYTETTFTTWNITIRSIEQDSEFGSLAMKILNTIAYFHADFIHRDSLINLTDVTRQSTGRNLGKYFIQLMVSEIFSLPTQHQKRRNYIEESPIDREELLESAVSLLIKYSMISSQERQTKLSIHRVVQDVIQVTLRVKDRERNVLRNALLLIEKLMKRSQHTTHAVSVFQHSLEYPDLVWEFSELPNTIVMNMITNLMKEDAVVFINQFMKKFETILGPNHPIFAKITFHLRYVNAYKYSRSLMCNETGYQMYEELCKMRADEFGQHDIDTMVAKFEIGQIFLRMGKVSEAFTILEGARQQIELTLGPAHPETLASEECVAVSYVQSGLYAEATQRLNVLLDKKRSLFGEGDTKTLYTFNSIGKVLHHQQKYTQALEVFQKICQNNELGEDHETRFRAMENLAHTYTKLGNYDEAVKIYKDVHERKARKLGENHPDTLYTLADFGVILLNQWKVTESMEIFRKICANPAQQEVNDEALLITMKNFGLAHARLGDYEHAEKIYNDVLTTRIKFQGKNHPDSLFALNDIGELFLPQEKFTDALPIFEEIYKNRIELGEENEVILTSMSNIAYIHSMLGNNDESLQLYKQLHMHKIRTLGENHPDTLYVLLDVARVLESVTNHFEALTIYESIYEKRMELGEENLIIRIALRQIARAYGQTGKYTEGLQILKNIHANSTDLGEDHPATLCALFDIGQLQIDQKYYTEALETFNDMYEKAMKISHNNEFIVRAMRGLMKCYLGMENYIKSWQLYRVCHTKNIEILEGSHLDNVNEFIITATKLVERGNCTEAFLIYKDIYQHRMSLVIADKDEIICFVRKKLKHLYDSLRSTRFIQKHLMEII